jgi:hypothetical protein
MLQSTPMLSQQDNADPRACQQDSSPPVWTRTGSVERIIAAVVRAYNDAHPAADVSLGHSATIRLTHTCSP